MWKTKLNDDLPSPLHQIEAWLREVEQLADADLPTSHDYYEAIALMEEKMALFKVGKEKKKHWNIYTLLRLPLGETLSWQEGKET